MPRAQDAQERCSVSDWGLCKGGEVRSYPIGVPGVFLADPMMGVARKVEVQKKKASSKWPR